MAVFEYGDTLLVFEVRGLVERPENSPFKRKVGNEFYTSEGMIANGLFTPKNGGKAEKLATFDAKVAPGRPFGSFLNAVRSRKVSECNADVEVAHLSCGLIHAANASYRLGEKVPFNNKAQKLGDSPAEGTTSGGGDTPPGTHVSKLSKSSCSSNPAGGMIAARRWRDFRPCVLEPGSLFGGKVMRSTVGLVTISAALASVGGCQDKKPVDAQTAAARVDAAMQITGHNERDEALAVACRSAAEAGARDAVLKGLPAIVSHNLRDEVAEDCALKLRAAGNAAAAAEVAALITSHNKRDEVLKKLATGS